MPLDLHGPEVEQAILQMAQQPVNAPTRDGIGPAPYLAMIGGNAADLLTTVQALQSGRGREGNPVLKGMGPKGIAATKIGATAAIAILMRELAKKHPDMAKWLGYGDGAAMGALAVHNAKVGR